MVELFHIGGISIHLFGITIALGILAGIKVMLTEGRRKGLDKYPLFDLGLYTVFAGLVGARINYILAFNLSYYLEHPVRIFMIQQGGLSIQGGLIAGAAFAFWYMRKHQIPLWKTADTFAPGIILGQAIGRIGCDVFGVPMEQEWPWGIEFMGNIVHPVQIYEVILNFALFLLLWHKRKSIEYEGQLFIYYIIGFSLNRFIVEFFRTNPLVFGQISIAHLYSAGMIIAALIAKEFLKKRSRKRIQAQKVTQKKGNKDLKNKDLTSGKENTAGSFLDLKVTGMVVFGTILAVVFYYWVHSTF